MKQPHINSPLISFLFTWFGLVPYKLYEGPGMLIAIVQMIVLQTIIPLQVHLIPHFLSYFILNLMYNISINTGIAFSLAFALCMEMMYSKTPRIFEYHVKRKETKEIIIIFSLVAALFVGGHSWNKRENTLLYILLSAIIGICVGFVSWFGIEIYKKELQNLINLYIG